MAHYDLELHQMDVKTTFLNGDLCGRTAWNSTLTEALVFHQTLSTPKASYNERYLSGTPQGRTWKIDIFS